MFSYKDKVVLVVDDEKELREIIGEEFLQLGATLLEAENGQKALEIFLNHQVDVIVSDIKMPNGNGIDLLTKIRSFNKNQPTFVVISGYSDFTPWEIYDLGAEGLFGKPSDLDVLTQSTFRVMQPLEDRWKSQLDILKEMASSNFHIQLEVNSINEALDLGLLGLGKGGMSIKLVNGAPPEIGSKVSFKIGHQFQGIGICRWKKIVHEPNISKSIGLEFDQLTEESLSILIPLLKKLSPRAFIPKEVGLK